MTLISIILVHYSDIQMTWECVESLLSSDYEGFNILIVDNSRDVLDSNYFFKICRSHGFQTEALENISKVLDFKKNIYWYSSNENLGYAGGMNLGARIIQKSKPDFLMLLNNDTLVSEWFLGDLMTGIETVASSQDFGFSGCLIRNWSDKEIWYAGGEINLERCMGEHYTDLPFHGCTVETGFITGCCMICRPDVYKELQGMDESFFLYMEDVDLCYRAKQKGYKLYFVPQVELYHRVGSSTGGDEKSLSVYYSARNRILLMRKHFSGVCLYRFFLFFFLSRLVKTIKWLILGKPWLVASLWKGMSEGYRKKV